MGNDHPDRSKQAESTPYVPSEAASSRPRRLEPLGEGYDEQDRQLDDALTGQARMLLQETPIPSGLNDRLMQGVQDALASEQVSLPFETAARPRTTHAWHRLALAACMGLAIVAGWWLLDRASPRQIQSGESAIASAPSGVSRPADDMMSVTADLAMLTSSSTNNEELDRLKALIATRDMRISDFNGDVLAVLDASHDPRLQAFDLEVWR